MERPIFRIGVAGLDPRDARLIEIVFRHGQRNPHDFRLLEWLDMTAIDILIANASESEGLDAMAAAREFPRHVPVVVAVPRGGQTAARHSVTIDRLTLQLLPILNRVVLDEGLQGQPEVASPLCDELTEIHPGEDDVATLAPVQSLPAAAAATTSMRATAAMAGRLSIVTPDTVPAPGCHRQTEPPEMPEPATAMAPAEAAGTTPLADPVGTVSADRLADAPQAGLESASHDPVSHDLVDPVPAIEPWSVIASDRGLPAGGHSGIGHRLRVLVADPSLAAQDQLAAELQQLGFDVDCVVSGAAAARNLAGRHFDLIVTENGLADTDGFTLVHWLRRSPAYRETPVILLRSRIGWLDSLRARLDGRMTVLGKPVSRRALARLVRHALRHSLVVDDFAV